MSKNLQAPVPVDNWKGVYDATYERPTCLTFMNTETGNEDCLYINVYTPNESPATSVSDYAVLVWIYGGAWIGGSSNTSLYSPDFIIDQDVVLVTFNYRLGPLGKLLEL